MEITIDAVAKISELHFLFENAIPHRTPLKPNNPAIVILRGNEHTHATTTPIPVPRSAYNADIREHTNIPINNMMPEITSSINITCPTPLLRAGIISSASAFGNGDVCSGTIWNVRSMAITTQVEMMNGAVKGGNFRLIIKCIIMDDKTAPKNRAITDGMLNPKKYTVARPTRAPLYP